MLHKLHRHILPPYRHRYCTYRLQSLRPSIRNVAKLIRRGRISLKRDNHPYSQVTVDPQKSIDYVQRNRNKKIIYRSFVTNSYNNITTESSFNALVNSGIVHPTAVRICPFLVVLMPDSETFSGSRHLILVLLLWRHYH